MYSTLREMIRDGLELKKRMRRRSKSLSSFDHRQRDWHSMDSIDRNNAVDDRYYSRWFHNHYRECDCRSAMDLKNHRSINRSDSEEARKRTIARMKDITDDIVSIVAWFHRKRFKFLVRTVGMKESLNDWRSSLARQSFSSCRVQWLPGIKGNSIDLYSSRFTSSCCSNIGNRFFASLSLSFNRYMTNDWLKWHISQGTFRRQNGACIRSVRCDYMEIELFQLPTGWDTCSLMTLIR